MAATLFQPNSSAASSSSSGTGKNYLSTYLNNTGNGDFELGTTTGWSKGNVSLTSSLPTGAPTFGSGSSANLSISIVSSSQLAGTYSLSYASSAATTAGDFLASDAFTIDAEDQAKVMTFQFYYKGQTNPSNANWSGTSSNSFGVAIYDVTNSQWIIPAGVWSMTQSSGIGYATGTFQTSATGTSYRIVVYNANATSNSITLYFDDFSLGPQTAPFGPIITDWTAWTPTGSWVSNSTYTGKWARVGDVMRLYVNIALAGAPTTASLTVNLPSGYTIDTAKIPSTVAGYGMLRGEGSANDSGNNAYALRIGYSSTTAIGINRLIGTGATAPTSDVNAVNETAPFTFGSGDSVNIYAEVPIVGWSSNLQMSNDTDTRIVAAIITGNPASATSGNPIIVPTVGYDSHAGYNATTGRYTVPVTGIYKVYGALTSASSATTLTIYKNAVSTSLAGNLDSNGEATYCSSVSCVAGDIIDIRPGGTVDATDMTLNIERTCGPAVVAATESINARYFASATSISGSLATVVWTTKDYDTHNAMASGVYTIPVSGKYQVNSAVANTGTFILNSLLVIEIQKNSSVVSRVKIYSGGAETQVDGIIADTISCVAGDTIRIQISNSGTGPAIVSSNFENYFSISRAGN